MNVEHVQWRWLLVLAAGVLVVSTAISAFAAVPLTSVLVPFAAMAVLGLLVGWMLRHIVRFNPYDY